MASAIVFTSGIGRSCPMPGIMRSSAPGIFDAVSLPPSTDIKGSRAPWTTTVGTLMVFSFARLSSYSPRAASALCRAMPARSVERFMERMTRSRILSSSGG